MMKYSITIFSLCFFLIIACSVTTFAEAENTNKGYTAFNTYNAGKVTYYSYSRNDVVPFTVEQLKEINEFIQKYFESAFPNFRSYGVTEIHLSAEAFDNVRLSTVTEGFDHNGYPNNPQRRVLFGYMNTNTPIERAGKRVVENIEKFGTVAKEYDKRPGPSQILVGQINEVIFKNQKPYYVNGVTYIPLREFAMAIKAEVEWNAAERSVTLKKDENQVYLVIDNPEITVNGEKITLKDPPFIDKYTSTTMVPVRLISETFDYQVDWDPEKETVHLHTKYEDELAVIVENLYARLFDSINKKDYSTFRGIDSTYKGGIRGWETHVDLYRDTELISIQITDYNAEEIDVYVELYHKNLLSKYDLENTNTFIYKHIWKVSNSRLIESEFIRSENMDK